MSHTGNSSEYEASSSYMGPKRANDQAKKPSASQESSFIASPLILSDVCDSPEQTVKDSYNYIYRKDQQGQEREKVASKVQENLKKKQGDPQIDRICSSSVVEFDTFQELRVSTSESVCDKRIRQALQISQQGLQLADQKQGQRTQKHEQEDEINGNIEKVQKGVESLETQFSVCFQLTNKMEEKYQALKQLLNGTTVQKVSRSSRKKWQERVLLFTPSIDSLCWRKKGDTFPQKRQTIQLSQMTEVSCSPDDTKGYPIGKQGKCSKDTYLRVTVQQPLKDLEIICENKEIRDNLIKVISLLLEESKNKKKFLNQTELKQTNNEGGIKKEDKVQEEFFFISEETKGAVLEQYYCEINKIMTQLQNTKEGFQQNISQIKQAITEAAAEFIKKERLKERAKRLQIRERGKLQTEKLLQVISRQKLEENGLKVNEKSEVILNNFEQSCYNQINSQLSNEQLQGYSNNAYLNQYYPCDANNEYDEYIHQNQNFNNLIYYNHQNEFDIVTQDQYDQYLQKINRSVDFSLQLLLSLPCTQHLNTEYIKNKGRDNQLDMAAQLLAVATEEVVRSYNEIKEQSSILSSNFSEDSRGGKHLKQQMIEMHNKQDQLSNQLKMALDEKKKREEQIMNMRREFEDKEKEIQFKSGEIESKSRIIDDKKKELLEKNKQLFDLTKANKQLTSDISQTNYYLQDKSKENVQLKNQIKEVQDALSNKQKEFICATENLTVLRDKMIVDINQLQIRVEQLTEQLEQEKKKNQNNLKIKYLEKQIETKDAQIKELLKQDQSLRVKNISHHEYESDTAGTFSSVKYLQSQNTQFNNSQQEDQSINKYQFTSGTHFQSANSNNSNTCHNNSNDSNSNNVAQHSPPVSSFQVIKNNNHNSNNSRHAHSCNNMEKSQYKPINSNNIKVDYQNNNRKQQTFSHMLSQDTFNNGNNNMQQNYLESSRRYSADKGAGLRETADFQNKKEINNNTFKEHLQSIQFNTMESCNINSNQKDSLRVDTKGRDSNSIESFKISSNEKSYKNKFNDFFKVDKQNFLKGDISSNSQNSKENFSMNTSNKQQGDEQQNKKPNYWKPQTAFDDKENKSPNLPAEGLIKIQKHMRNMTEYQLRDNYVSPQRQAYLSPNREEFERKINMMERSSKNSNNNNIIYTQEMNNKFIHQMKQQSGVSAQIIPNSLLANNSKRETKLLSQVNMNVASERKFASPPPQTGQKFEFAPTMRAAQTTSNLRLQGNNHQRIESQQEFDQRMAKQFQKISNKF